MVNETNNILKVLIENKQENWNIRKLSKIRKINYKSAYNAVKALEKEKIIGLQAIGNTTLCSFKNKFSPRVFEVEYERRENIIRDKNFKIIYNRLNEKKMPFISLLFGSWAKKTATKNSDIDLLFVITDENLEKELRQEISLIPLEIHATFVSYTDFMDMANSKKFSVVTEAIKNNIILIGIEEYYRILENVK